LFAVSRYIIVYFAPLCTFRAEVIVDQNDWPKLLLDPIKVCFCLFICFCYYLRKERFCAQFAITFGYDCRGTPSSTIILIETLFDLFANFAMSVWFVVLQLSDHSEYT